MIDLEIGYRVYIRHEFSVFGMNSRYKEESRPGRPVQIPVTPGGNQLSHRN
jgi:hypothetical protein